MATNPMQRKSRISFFLGMLLMFIIAMLVVAFLYLKIKSQQDEIQKYKPTVDKVVTQGGATKKVEGNAREVYVLNQNVVSGQVLTAEMFTKKIMLKTLVPENVTNNINITLGSFSLMTKDGKEIYYNVGTTGNTEDPTYYYLGTAEDRRIIYRTNSQGKDEIASDLKVNDKAFYYAGANNTQRTEIEISQNAVAAKIDLYANTVITTAMLTRTDEVTTNDLRKEEYNVIALPVDLKPDEYIDVRLMLPNGQNYIVTSRKKVSIPVVDGQYLSDTIQMNLTEEEILLLSCAIIENYHIEVSKLYATRYTEAGNQTPATITYYPNRSVQTLLDNDPNMVRKAINGIIQKRQTIRDAIDKSVSDDGKSENISTKSETSITSTLEQRKNYLQSLPAIQ